MKEYYTQSTELQAYMKESKETLDKVWKCIDEMKERIRKLEEKTNKIDWFVEYNQ